MKRLATIAALALALSGSTALAAVDATHAPPSDPRIRTVDYHPQQVVRLVGVFRTATQIRFGADETIQHVALGDTSGWEVAAEGAVMFVKPTAGRAPTNLIVTTTGGGGRTRHYTFELSTRHGSISQGSPNTFFVLQFRYPETERAQLTTVLSAEAQALERKILQLRLERGAVEGPRNLAYELQGSTALAPSEVSDNGRFTVLRFPGAQAVPAVYAVTPDGEERLVPFDVRGEFLVIHQTAAQFRLRRGRDVLCVLNQAYRAAGVNLGTGTASSQIDRTVAAEPKP